MSLTLVERACVNLVKTHLGFTVINAGASAAKQIERLSAGLVSMLAIIEKLEGIVEVQRKALGEMMTVYAGIGISAGWEIAPENRQLLNEAAELARYVLNGDLIKTKEKTHGNTSSN